MAYIAEFQKSTGLDMPVPPHQVDDYLIAIYTQSSGSVAVPLGWTLIDTFSTINSYLGIAYYKKAASSSETVPNAQNVAGNTEFGETLVIRGADTTTFLGAILGANHAGKSYQSPNLTPTYDDSLIIYINHDGANSRHAVPEQGITEIIRNTSGQGFHGISYSYGGAASVALGTHNYIGQYTSTWTQYFLVFEVKDDGTGKNQGYASRTPAATLLHMLGSNGHSGALNGTSLTYDPTVEIPTVTNDNTGYSDTTQYDAIDGGDELLIGIYNGSIENASATSNVLIAGTDLLTTTDLSGKILSLTYSGVSRTPTAKVAKVFGLTDTTNSRLWQIDGANLTPNGSALKLTTAIEVDGAFAIDDLGTFNSSAVTGLILAGEVNSGTTGQSTFGFLYELGTMRVVGGSSVVPATMATAAAISKTSALNTVQNQIGLTDTQYFCSQSIQIGESTTKTIFVGAGQAVSFPGVYNYDRLKVQFKLTEGAIGFSVELGNAATVIDLSDMMFNMGDFHTWQLVAGTVGTLTSGNCAISNSTPILDSIGSTVSGLTFSTFREVSYTTLADLSGGNTFIGGTGTQAITVTSEADFAKLANCTFRDNTVAIKITGDQTGTWSDPNLTVSGNTYDIEYTGTTNFSIQSANTLTVNNSSSGVLSFVTPTFDLTVNSSESASQINVFTTTTQTIIATEASNTQLVYTHASETVDITVLKDGYIPFRQTGVVLSGTVTIDVQLVKSREYLSTHGLTYTTDASWATNQLTVPTYGVTGQQVFSLIMEAFKSQTALRNTAFNLQMDGANSLYLVNDAEGASDASIENLVDCGVAYINTAGTTTASWCGIKSVGTATGFTGEYQQVAGSGTTDARATGVFNQLVKMYGDISHGNFDYTDHLVMKYQPNGYREKRVDVLDSYGISALSPTLYIVAMQPVTIAAAVGDPALTLTITDHGATPVTWNTKDFSITVTADAADSGEDILRELNYNLSLDATYNGKDPFNWPEMVLEAGTAYETARGITEGGAGATLKGVRVIDGSGNPHPAFTRMQADDGTYYVVPITANISISNLPDDVGGSTELQIYNVTTATLVYSGDPAGTSYSDSYTDGDLAYASAGDTIRIRFAHANAGTSFEVGQTITVASSSGIVADGDNFIAADDVYATNGIDGSTVTKFTYTPVNDQFNLIINSNFTAAEMYAFYCYTLTTTDGIEGAYGAFVASDAGNYKNITAITSIYLDNETTASKRQTDTARIYRDDGAYPVLDPTTSGFGIDINWQNVVYVVTAGSGLTAPQAAELTAAAGASTFDPATDVVEGTETWTEAMRLVRANAAGKLAVSGTTVTMRDAADTKDRITATVDSDGQRTAITTDVS